MYISSSGTHSLTSSSSLPSSLSLFSFFLSFSLLFLPLISVFATSSVQPSFYLHPYYSYPLLITIPYIHHPLFTLFSFFLFRFLRKYAPTLATGLLGVGMVYRASLTLVGMLESRDDGGDTPLMVALQLGDDQVEQGLGGSGLGSGVETGLGPGHGPVQRLEPAQASGLGSASASSPGSRPGLGSEPGAASGPGLGSVPVTTSGPGLGSEPGAASGPGLGDGRVRATVLELVRALVLAGADVAAKNRHTHMTPFLYAVRSGTTHLLTNLPITTNQPQSSYLPIYQLLNTYTYVFPTYTRCRYFYTHSIVT